MTELLATVLLVIILGPLALCIVIEVLTLIVEGITAIGNMFTVIFDGIEAALRNPTLWMVVGGLLILLSVVAAAT